MMLRNRRIIYLVVLLAGLAIVVYYQKSSNNTVMDAGSNSGLAGGHDNADIDKLTGEKVVIPYVKQHRKLPDYYVTKQEARAHGWIAAEGNLCSVWPGKAIGGDVFTNREGRLPRRAGRKWFEADLNYNCGRRNADRLLFSTDGLIFVTYDHYKTFQQK